jgi:hypothetical protein
LWKLAFGADVTKHVNEFNAILKGEDGLTCDVCMHVKHFKKKKLPPTLGENNFVNFPCCEMMRVESELPVPTKFTQP